MKKEKDLKPVYEAPKVFRLDETDSMFGQAACDPGSNPGTDCSTGANASGICQNNGTNPVAGNCSVGPNVA